MATISGDKNPNNLNDTINGTSAADFLSGLRGSDTLSGLAGDDVLNGGTNPAGFVSFDYLDGGEGVDTLRFIAGPRDDGTRETADANFSISTNGTWVVNSFTPGANFYVQAVNMERLTFVGGDGNDTVNFDNYSSNPPGNPGAPYGGNYLNGGAATNGDHLLLDLTGPAGAPWANTHITFDTRVQNIIPGFGTIGGFEQISMATGKGNDKITSGRLIDAIITMAGNDIIDPGTHPVGFVASDLVHGGPGTDTLVASSPYDKQDIYFYAGAVGDWTIGGSANQLYIVAKEMERIDFQGGGGDDTFDITGAKGGSLNGFGVGNGVDHLIADFSDYKGRIDYSVFHNGNDLPGFSIANVDRITLTTGRGNDQIVGLYHTDVIKTGAGNDTINPRSKKPTGLNDFIDGGAGVDTFEIDIRSDPGAKYAGLAMTATLNGITSNKGTVGVEAHNMEIFEFQGGTRTDDVTGGKLADFLSGNEGNDKLFGGAGDDELQGWAGTDLLVGGLGRDELFGGFHGRDIFKFESIRDSVVGARRDVITGMGGGATSVDKIDLADIDANTKLAGDQKFKFIGTQAFHDEAGEVRYRNHILQADVNGDGNADFEVHVNQNVLTTANFIL